MRSAILLFALCLPVAAETALNEQERRAEDRALRKEVETPAFQDELKKWRESARGDDAQRQKAERILREETSRDVADPDAPERRPKPEPKKTETSKSRSEDERSSGRSPPVPPISGSLVGAFLWAILILVGGAAVAFGLYALVMAIMNRRRAPAAAESEAIAASEEAARGGAAPPVVRHPEEWLAEARRLAAAGRWLEALRCLLFASLERLHRARFIDYQRAATNRECVRAFKGEDSRRAPFGALVDAFDVAVYGQRPFGAADYARAEQAALELGRGVGDEGQP